jgi:lipoprotein-anchoring transpeptidase ErfK/SrfK
MSDLDRRSILTGALAIAASAGLAGCNQTARTGGAAQLSQNSLRAVPSAESNAEFGDYASMYGPVDGEPFPVAGINLKKLDPQFLRREVSYSGREEPGTIVIDPANHFLYHVSEGGKAVRYGVGVGREGFAWNGAASINSKQEWPDWYPPKEMIEREPKLAAKLDQLQSGIGMHGGTGNPLGARAMYLWQNNKDTLYRIHGTIEPYSIGKSVSSGCIRMINQDVMDLYARTPVGTKVVVLGSGIPVARA